VVFHFSDRPHRFLLDGLDRGQFLVGAHERLLGSVRADAKTVGGVQIFLLVHVSKLIIFFYYYIWQSLQDGSVEGSRLVKSVSGKQ
jgi:hypothetical protein